MLRLRGKSKQSRRTAFSLAELVISIGVLILMMALAGQVFTITIKSTGQATALTEVTQQLRVLEETLREDLRNVQPGQSVMLIQGNPVNAYWTQAGKEADDNSDPSDGYGHVRDLEREKLKVDGTPDLDSNQNEKLVEPRADILMFFTARKATSSVNPAVSSRVQHVVYGHSEVGEYEPDTSAPGTYQMVPDLSADPLQSIFPVDPATLYPTLSSASRVPASQWHLARRSVLLVPNGLATAPGTVSWDAIANPNANGGLGNLSLMDGQVDAIGDFRYADLVLQPIGGQPGWDSLDPWYLPAVFGNTLNTPPADWHKPHARGKLDSTPPMMLANRMGAYFAPNCASFKVEWSLDPSSPFVNGRLDRTNQIFWFDPGDDRGTPGNTSDDDPLHTLSARVKELKDKGVCTKESDPLYNLCDDLSSLLCEQTFHGDDWPVGSLAGYSLADRFVGKKCDPLGIGKSPSIPEGEWEQLSAGGQRPNIATFTAFRHGPPGTPPVPDVMWPGALRITVDMFDRQGRLERPIRHVMVIPVGR